VRDPNYMREFTNPTRTARTGPRVHWHRSGARWIGRLQPPFAHKNPVVAKDALFRANDWVGVKHLLEDEKTSQTSPVSYDTRDMLASSLLKLRTSLGAPILRAGPVVGELIDVWALAKEVDPDAARPAEALLWAMEGCDLVTAGQVSATCDRIDGALSRPLATINGPSRPRLLRSDSQNGWRFSGALHDHK
jgi:hypothetical protein